MLSAWSCVHGCVQCTTRKTCRRRSDRSAEDIECSQCRMHALTRFAHDRVFSNLAIFKTNSPQRMWRNHFDAVRYRYSGVGSIDQQRDKFLFWFIRHPAKDNVLIRDAGVRYPCLLTVDDIAIAFVTRGGLHCREV